MISVDYSALLAMRELEFDVMTPYIFLQIECPSLRKFVAKELRNFRDASIFKTFADNNPKIEHLELVSDAKSRQASFNFKNSVVHLIKHLPQLKILNLSLSYIFESTALVKLIGEKCANLEHLEMQLSFHDAKKAAGYFKKKYPHLGCDLRQLGGIDRWLIRVRQI